MMYSCDYYCNYGISRINLFTIRLNRIVRMWTFNQARTSYLIPRKNFEMKMFHFPGYLGLDFVVQVVSIYFINLFVNYRV